MSVLWVGGEDIDFPLGSTTATSTTSTTFRSGYGRCSTSCTSGMAKSTLFPGGAITSCWLSFRAAANSTSTAAQKQIGLGASGTTKGLFIGSAAGTSNRLAICKYDGTTTTELATETGNSLATGVLNRYDVQLANYGSTATVNVYQNGALLISYSGDVSISGVSGFDSVFIFGVGSFFWNFSEIVVADEDPRAWPGVFTMALTGAGTTASWTNNTFSNINGTTISDVNPVSSNTDAQDQQYNITDPPSGTYTIKAVKVAARSAKSASPAVSQIKLGFNSAGTTAVGAAIPVTTAYATYESYNSVNPVTGSAFLQSEMTALQLDVRSAT